MNIHIFGETEPSDSFKATAIARMVDSKVEWMNSKALLVSRQKHFQQSLFALRSEILVLSSFMVFYMLFLIYCKLVMVYYLLAIVALRFMTYYSRAALDFSRPTSFISLSAIPFSSKVKAFVRRAIFF